MYTVKRFNGDFSLIDVFGHVSRSSLYGVYYMAFQIVAGLVEYAVIAV